LVSDNNTIIVQ